MKLSEYDWRKHAAAVLNDEQVEKAFADQAFSFVAQRAGKLMNPPYILGFEMIYSNDDKTRLVGIFAFKVGRDLIYAPCFFLNGQIKGQDLLYRVQPHKFVPLTEDWVNFLLERNNDRAGRGLPRNQTDRLEHGVDLTPLMVPRRTKYANFEPPKIEDFLPKRHGFAPTGLISKFIKEEGLYGVKAARAIANMVEKSAAFADGLVACINSVEELEPEWQEVKLAKAVNELVIHVGLTKSASADNILGIAKHGYAIDDKRPQEAVSEIYEGDTDEYVSITAPGVYAVNTMDGSHGKALFGTAAALRGMPSGQCEYIGYSDPAKPYGSDRRSLIAVFDSPKSMSVIDSASVLGRAQMEEETGDFGSETPSTGKAYALWDKSTNKISTEGYYVCQIDDGGDGLKTLTLARADIFGISHYDIKVVLHNTDAPETDWDRGILNGDIRFIPLELVDKNSENEPVSGGGVAGVKIPSKKLKAPPVLMPANLTTEALISVGMRKAKIRLQKENYEVSFGGKKVARASRAKIATMLCGQFAFPASATEELLDRAITKEQNIYFCPPVKMASAMTRLIEREDFTPSYDDLFNTAVENPRSFSLQTQTDDPRLRVIPFNETYDPALGGPGNQDREHMDEEEILNMDPAALQQVANSRNLPNVFEHGAIGSLVKSFDATALIDKYMANWEESLDHLGRSLFLYYWKPQDFERAFGKDDMVDMEAELGSNFKSFGALVLNLMQKSRNRQTGSVALT